MVDGLVELVVLVAAVVVVDDEPKCLLDTGTVMATGRVVRRLLASYPK